MKKEIIDPLAKADIREAVLFYEDEKEGLGFALNDTIKDGIEQICKWPAMYPFIKEPYRGLFLEKFPYTIIYRIESDFVYIASVVHQSRHPDYWKNRLKNRPS